MSTPTLHTKKAPATAPTVIEGQAESRANGSPNHVPVPSKEKNMSIISQFDETAKYSDDEVKHPMVLDRPSPTHDGTPTGHPKLAPITCSPWCKDHDGHPEESHPDDQRCSSNSEFVALSLEPQWQSWDGGWNKREIELFAESGPTRHPAVVIYDCGAEHQVTLDVREARALSQAIAKIADLMEAAR